MEYQDILKELTNWCQTRSDKEAKRATAHAATGDEVFDLCKDMFLNDIRGLGKK